MAGGWVKLHRGGERLDYLLARPAVWALLTLIAIRARREPGTDPRTGIHLEAGEALVGDHQTVGLSRQQYRAALATLKTTNIATTRATTKGTIAKLIDLSIYDINCEQANHQPNQQNTTEPTTNKNLEEDKKPRRKEKPSRPRPSESDDFFQSLWERYPRKIGRAEALKAYRRSVKTPEDREKIKRALDNYLEHLRANHTEARYTKGGGKWFAAWEEYVDPAPAQSDDWLTSWLLEQEGREQEVEKSSKEYWTGNLPTPKFAPQEPTEQPAESAPAPEPADEWDSHQAVMRRCGARVGGG